MVLRERAAGRKTVRRNALQKLLPCPVPCPPPPSFLPSFHLPPERIYFIYFYLWYIIDEKETYTLYTIIRHYREALYKWWRDRWHMSESEASCQPFSHILLFTTSLENAYIGWEYIYSYEMFIFIIIYTLYDIYTPFIYIFIFSLIFIIYATHYMCLYAAFTLYYIKYKILDMLFTLMKSLEIMIYYYFLWVVIYHAA